MSVTSREQEFKLLVASKYLVESQGKVDLDNPQLKSYKFLDGTEIQRDRDFLTITYKGQELKFDKNNATVKNTFFARELKFQIKARNKEMQQHFKQNRTQIHSLTIGR